MRKFMMAAAFFLGLGLVTSKADAQLLQDMVLGRPDAPVTIIEYSSLTCPHCANFHVNSLPTFKEQYIDTGKVRLIYRDFPFEPIGTKAAQLARCMPNEDSYFRFLDILFRQQMQWSRAADPIAALVDLGKLAGLSEERARACVNDPKIEEYVLGQRIQGQRDGVNSTPTFVINGQPYPGARSPQQLAQLVDPIIAGGGTSPEVERQSYWLGVAVGVLLAILLAWGAMVWLRRRKS